MALRLRRALSLSYSLLHHSLHQPKPLPSISSSVFSTPVSASGPSAAVNHSSAQSTRSFTSTSALFAKVFDPETDEIGPDTILFEGCDYEHWLITVDFPKDSNLTREQMIETYVNIAAQVFGSMEEAKKKIYALSTTTYQGFQVVCSEETSEKFKDVPGVVFVLPDSYIDTVNKEYGGDKYINGEIIPRPPPVHYGRHENRGRRGRQDHSWSREQQNYGPPPQQQNYGPQPQQQNYNRLPPQQQNYGPPPQQQNYGLPPQQQNYGPPPQQQNYGPPPQQQNYGPPPPQQNYGPLPQQNHGPPPQQNHSPPPRHNYGPPPKQNYGPPPQQNYGSPPQQNYGPPPQQNYVPQGHQGYGNTTSSLPQQNFGPSPQQNHGPSPQQNFVPRGPQGYGNPPSPPPQQNYGPQVSGDLRSFTSPGNSNADQGNYAEGQRDFQQGNFQSHISPERSDLPQGTGYRSSGGGGFEQTPVGAQKNFSSTGNN